MLNNCTQNTSYNNSFDRFSKVNYASNKQYLSNAYGKQVQYYDQYGKCTLGKMNKKSKKKMFILLATGLTIAGAIATTIISRNKIDYSKIFDSENLQKLFFKDANTEKKVKNFLNRTSNASVNLVNIKDDIWDRTANLINEKTPFKFVKTLGNKATNWYKRNVYKACEKSFQRSKEQILSLECGEEIKKKLLETDYKKLYENLDQGIEKSLKKDSISKSIFDDSIKEKNTKEFFKKITNPIADSRIKSAIKKNAQLLEIPQDASEELKNTIEKYNKIQTEILIPKLRDINCGSAPTDILSILGVSGMFGIGLANTDSKEERKSTLLNIGIPLLPTICMPIIGTYFPVLNGVKALIAGLAAGQVASNGAKLLDKKLSSKEENK